MASPRNQHVGRTTREDSEDFETKNLSRHAPSSEGRIVASETSVYLPPDVSERALFPRLEENPVVPSVATWITESTDRHPVPSSKTVDGISTFSGSEAGKRYPSVSSEVIVLKSGPKASTLEDVGGGRTVSSEGTSGRTQRGSDAYDATYVVGTSGKTPNRLRSEMDAALRSTASREPARKQQFVKSVNEGFQRSASTTLRQSLKKNASSVPNPAAPGSRPYMDAARYRAAESNASCGKFTPSNHADGFSTTRATHSSQGIQSFISETSKMMNKTVAAQGSGSFNRQTERGQDAGRAHRNRLAPDVSAEQTSDPLEVVRGSRETQKDDPTSETDRVNPSVKKSKDNRGPSCSRTNGTQPRSLSSDVSSRREETSLVAVQKELPMVAPSESWSVRTRYDETTGNTVVELSSAPVPRCQEVGSISECNGREWFVSEDFGVSGAVVSPGVCEMQDSVSLPVELSKNALQGGSDLVETTPVKDTRSIVVTKRQLVLYPATVLTFAVIMAAILTFLFPRRVETSRQILDFALNKSTVSNAADEPKLNVECEACSENGSFLNDLLSWKADPCDNFYHFVCDRPAEKRSRSTRDASRQGYTHQFEVAMYRVLQRSSEVEPPLKTVKNLFRECLRLKDIENSGWDQVLELLALASLEGFPFSPPVRKSSSIWKIVAKVLRLTGAAVLLNVDVAVHPLSQHRDVVILDVPDTLVRVNGGDINEAVRSYYGMVYTSVKKLRKQFFPAVHTMQVISLAYELERLYLEKRGRGKANVEKLSKFPELTAFLSEVFDGVVTPVYSGDDSDIVLKSPEFVLGVVELVKSADAHTVMNLLGVRLMVHASAFIPATDLLDIYGTFLYQTRKTLIPRWKLCVRVVGHTVPPLFILASLTDARIKSVITDLSSTVRNVVGEVVQALSQAAFLDDTAKETAKSLVATVQYKVYGPDWVGDKTSVEEYFLGMPKVMQGQSLMSFVALQQHTFTHKLARSSGGRWPSELFREDCWTEDGAKTIYVPVLLSNVSSHETTMYEAPRVSVRVAECIFEMLFEKADRNAWLNDESRHKAENVVRCFDKQFASQDVPPLQRMANTAALRPALRHFVAHSPGDAQSRSLGPEQFFFIYLMMHYCEKTQSAGGLLLNLAMRNEPAFHNAFKCASSSAMNPPERCLLWKQE